MLGVRCSNWPSLVRGAAALQHPHTMTTLSVSFLTLLFNLTHVAENIFFLFIVICLTCLLGRENAPLRQALQARFILSRVSGSALPRRTRSEGLQAQRLNPRRVNDYLSGILALALQNAS